MRNDERGGGDPKYGHMEGSSKRIKRRESRMCQSILSPVILTKSSLYILRVNECATHTLAYI